MEHGIVLQPEILGYFQNFPITNSLFTSWLVMTVIIVITLAVRSKVSLVPTSKLASLFEVIIEAGFETVENLAHGKAKVFFPIVMTFFLYILCKGNFCPFVSFLYCQNFFNPPSKSRNACCGLHFDTSFTQ